MDASALVRIERSGPVATLVLSRPEKLNALSAAMLEAIDGALDGLASDPHVRGVIVTGAGERAFAAGADLGEITGLGDVDAAALSRRGQRVFLRVERFPKPVIAAIRGVAMGGGCELAIACHLRIASHEARLGLPEVGLGLLPGFGGTVRLAKLVGLGRALELILAGDPVDAATALQMGLINEAVPGDSLESRARDRMLRILENGPLAIEAALECVHHALEVSPDEAFEYEAERFGSLAASRDGQEGVRAFLERRRPRFSGR